MGHLAECAATSGVAASNVDMAAAIGVRRNRAGTRLARRAQLACAME
jgi:hypothetical protein